MGIRDELGKLGKSAVNAIGASLTDWAGVGNLSKADNSDSTPGNVRQDTAQGNPIPTEKATADPKAMLWDPYSIVEQLGYKDRPSSITYGTLKAITYRMPVVQAIIQTRINQIASFCVPQPDEYGIGFKIKLRESEKEPTKAELNWIKQAETLILRTGVTDNPRGRDSFEMFMRKIMWDSMAYDQATFEVIPNRKGKPAKWVAVDAATMRLADSANFNYDEDDVNAIRTVQIYDGMVVAEFNQEEMCFGVRNPRTDIHLQGYGVSEIEMLIPTITALLYSFDLNTKFFTQGSATKGILNFKGTVPEKQLQAFRRQWYTQIASVTNAWRTPITNVPEGDLQWINMQQSAKDMEFSAWMDFQIKLACSIFTIDPSEINFQYGNTGQKSTLNEGDNTQKITESKDRGLKPLLRFGASLINQYILWPINESFEFEFVGLNAGTKGEEADHDGKLVKSYKTVDEIRAKNDLPALPDGKGEVILDPTWLQWATMKDGGGEPEEGGFPGGEPGEDTDTDTDGGDDYEKLLAQYENEETEGDEKSDEDTEKSMTPQRWAVNL